MRALVFLVVIVGTLWTVDTFSLHGRIMQAAKETASLLYKRTEYDIWKLRFYYTH
ncbi:MAG TPA: hypothetical protein VK251_02745 [Steroidobacteraceae bacterium]|nr:hypothetical protein [Steroidobacteraceae bacterium]